MTTTDTSDKLAPIHPGEVLMEDFIEGFGITQNKLAVSIAVLDLAEDRIADQIEAIPPLQVA